MGERRGNSRDTKDRILLAARRLFAERDIATVSIRDIASEAGVSHGLVQRYFGSREQMVEAIVRQEVADFHATALPALTPDSGGWDQLRAALTDGWPQFHDFAAVVARAELAGLAPGQMLDPQAPTPAARIADVIAAGQADASPGSAEDARIVSAYVTAALFAFATMGPWLMATVGMTEADLEERFEDIIDISIDIMRAAAQRP